MNHEQAMSFALKQINERIEEIGAEARRAKEEGDDERNTAARNFAAALVAFLNPAITRPLVVLSPCVAGRPNCSAS